MHHKSIHPLLLILIMVDLLDLSLVSLLATLSYDSDSVQSNTLTLSITIRNEQYQACDVLEFDEAEGKGCGASQVPVFG